MMSTALGFRCIKCNQGLDTLSPNVEICQGVSNELQVKYQHKVCIKLEATRQPISQRFDLIEPCLLNSLADIGQLSSTKYDENNWKKSRLTGDKSPLNHAIMHINRYRTGRSHDHFHTRGHELAAAVFNLMMEMWYLENLYKQEPSNGQD